MTNSVAMFNSHLRLDYLKTFPFERNQTSFQVWVGIVYQRSLHQALIPERTSEDSSQPERPYWTREHFEHQKD